MTAGAVLAETAMWTLAQGTEQAGAGEGSMFLVWGFLLGAAAVALFVAELFVPSGGLIGLLCVCCLVGSVFFFMKHDPAWGVAAIATYCVLAPVALVFGLKLWSHSPLARKLILGGEEGDDVDDEEAMEASERARRERLEALRALIGAEGEAVTPLRPVGFVVIEGRRIDALAEGSVIDAGTPVVVVDVVDNQLKVRPR